MEVADERETAGKLPQASCMYANHRLPTVTR
jgi:hypothetical protein